MPNPIEVQKALAGITYPAGKSDVLDCAKKNGADDALINDLERLPDDEFSGPDQVEKALF